MPLDVFLMNMCIVVIALLVRRDQTKESQKNMKFNSQTISLLLNLAVCVLVFII